MGYITLGFALVLGVLFLANLRSRLLYHGPDYSFLGLICVYAIVTGAGLLWSRRWAALMFALPTYAAGLFLVIGGLAKVPFPWMLLDVMFGIVLCAAPTVVLRDWRQLKWV
jgi:hypothetical protein